MMFIVFKQVSDRILEQVYDNYETEEQLRLSALLFTPGIYHVVEYEIGDAPHLYIKGPHKLTVTRVIELGEV